MTEKDLPTIRIFLAQPLADACNTRMGRQQMTQAALHRAALADFYTDKGKPLPRLDGPARKATGRVYRQAVFVIPVEWSVHLPTDLKEAGEVLRSALHFHLAVPKRYRSGTKTPTPRAQADKRALEAFMAVRAEVAMRRQ